MAADYGTAEWDDLYEKTLQERIKSKPKPWVVGTIEWVQAFHDAIIGDEKYKEEGANWEDSVTLCIRAKPELGLESPLYVFLDLFRGDCKSARLLPEEGGEQAGFVFTGDYDVWKSVAQLELDTIKATMQGKIKLTGNLSKILKEVNAAKRLAQLAGLPGTVWPDDLSEEELEAFKADVKELRALLGV